MLFRSFPFPLSPDTMEVPLPGGNSIEKGVYVMPLHKDFIRKAVNDAVKKHWSSVPEEEIEKILVSAIYNIFNSRDFENYIKEIVK